MKLFFVGATGNVGRRVVPFLKHEFDLVLGARGGGEVAGLPVVDFDVTDWDSTLQAVRESGADVIVNCAIQNYQNPDGSDQNWNDVDQMRRYHSGAVDVNVKGAFHLYEAAQRAGIRRVVTISSITVVLGGGADSKLEVGQVGVDPPEFPGNIYACTKHCAEELGRVFTLDPQKPLDVICLRLGQPIPTDVTNASWVDTPRKRGIALAHGDTARAIACAARAPLRGFHAFQIVSRADENWIDVSAAQAIGYEPKYHFGPDGMTGSDGKMEAFE